jgi:hypothetical protein
MEPRPATLEPPVAAPEASAIGQQVVTVTGANPSRPAGVFLLISGEPAVLFKKRREEAGDGARIVLGRDERISIAIAPDELIRVTKGRDLTILYQGQKVSRQIIDGGSWISFVPK